MVNFQMVKSPVRWSLFILVVCLIAVIIAGIDYTLNQLNIQVSSLIISIVAGLFSGAILIVFDIIVFQGFEYEDTKKEERIKEIVDNVIVSAIYNPEIRNVLREEIKRALTDVQKRQ